MAKLYAIEIKVCATAYIKADSPEQALAHVEDLHLTGWELSKYAGEPISGLQFDDPNLPSYSVSPVMTVHGPWDSRDTPDMVHDYDNPES